MGFFRKFIRYIGITKKKESKLEEELQEAREDIATVFQRHYEKLKEQEEIKRKEEQELEELKDRIRDYEIPGYSKKTTRDSLLLAVGDKSKRDSYVVYTVSFIPQDKNNPSLYLRESQYIGEEIMEVSTGDNLEIKTVDGTIYSFGDSLLFDGLLELITEENGRSLTNCIYSKKESLNMLLKKLDKIKSRVTKGLEDITKEKDKSDTTDIELQYA